MRTDGVAVGPPLLDQYPGLLQIFEELWVSQLTTQSAVEALVMAVRPNPSLTPQTARLFEERLRTDPADPVPDGLCGKLASIVGAAVGRKAKSVHAE